jgi:hypothetical protein
MNSAVPAGLVFIIRAYPGLRPGLLSGRPLRGWTPEMASTADGHGDLILEVRHGDSLY